MEQKRNSVIWFSGLLVLSTLLAGFLIGKGWERPGHASESYEEMKIFADVLHQVKMHYVDKTETKELVHGAVRGMLATLDPHSSYMTPDMYKEMQVETKGEFGGLGIQIGVKDQRLTVIAPIEDTPAYRTGIEAGDIIAKVDEKLTKDLTLMEAVQHMRGPRGTKVNLTILREGSPEPIVITIVRDIIKIKSVRKKILDDRIGYVRISQFQESTPDDLEKALADLREQDMQALVLDLRNNPGGLLTAAVGVSEQFLEPDKLVVSIKGRNDRKDEYRARINSAPEDYPMIVLVNKGSASASEIVAAAMQDWGKAVIIGTTTFGKGSVQTILPLTDGSGLRLTTAKYYTPRGESIHSIGVKPDIVVEMKPVTVAKAIAAADEKTAASSGEISPGTASKLESEGSGNSSEAGSGKEDPQVRKDVQLQKAIELLKTWKVFKELEPH